MKGVGKDADILVAVHAHALYFVHDLWLSIVDGLCDLGSSSVSRFITVDVKLLCFFADAVEVVIKRLAIWLNFFVGVGRHVVLLNSNRRGGVFGGVRDQNIFSGDNES